MSRHEYVVLGDVVGSRDIEDREGFRDAIASVLGAVNERYADDVVGEFALVKGVDEIAGVVRDPRNLYRLLRDVVAAARPGAIRFAVVYGEIDVDAAGDSVVAMDGPAFHRADELLADVADADLYLAFAGRWPPLDGFVGACVNLLLMAREDWTDRQRAMVAAYEEAGTQAAVADRFGVSQQTVSSTLRRADWARLAHLEAVVNEALGEYASAGEAAPAGLATPAAEVEDGRS